MENGTFKEALKKGDIVTIETPNGVSVRAMVIHADNSGCDYYEDYTAELGSFIRYWEYLLYAQNRVFTATSKEDHLV